MPFHNVNIGAWCAFNVTRIIGSIFSSDAINPGTYSLRLLLLCEAGDYQPNVLQPFEIYCTNLALVPPFISRGAPRQPV
jgi:hypothetical protein